MHQDIVKIHKINLEYISCGREFFGRRINNTTAKVILTGEDMIVKFIPIENQLEKSREKIIEKYIENNFYNHNNMLFHYEIIKLDKKKTYILLYCLNHNKYLEDMIKKYKRINIETIQNILAEYILSKDLSKEENIIFYKSDNVNIILISYKGHLVHSSMIKDTDLENLRGHLSLAISEIEAAISYSISNPHFILINYIDESIINKYLPIKDIKEAFILRLSESELLTDYGNKKV